MKIQKKKLITIFYGNDSDEEIKIDNLKIKDEIFNYLKEKLSKLEYSRKKPSVLKHAKAPLFAILFVSGIFLWTFYLASQIAKGYEYEIAGGKQGIGSLILGMAQFGTTKVILGYLLILSIAFFSLIKKLKNRSLTEYLNRN
ncbi:hypothetical protein LPB136_11980 [Tenacibaculum todarodis]|uniref:Uncharacterized protein n=1 Tax=Tenacibaculum todarodis TaxID=1850252 RepID=A0A1L3JLP5_9FLAO|nr:hypothetical protein LPB136_11980 [Tenacibaculum todarodis]